MKKLYSLLLLPLFLSCNTASNIDKADICGKEFTSTVQDPMYNDVSSTDVTTLKCDGTFDSMHSKNLDHPSEHSLASANRHFTGTWQIVKEVPENVKQAVIEYGLKADDHNYSIIKYSSSNGVNGYCLFSEVDSNYSLEPLNTGQVSEHDWGHVSGAAGILSGFSAK